MSDLLEVNVVTPERSVFRGPAEFAVVPGYDDGEVGFLPGHARYIGILGIGEMRVREPGGQVQRFAVFEGFAEVAKNKVTVIANRAMLASEITDEQIEETRRELAAMPSRTRAEYDAHQRKMRELRARIAVHRRAS